MLVLTPCECPNIMQYKMETASAERPDREEKAIVLAVA